MILKCAFSSQICVSSSQLWGCSLPPHAPILQTQAPGGSVVPSAWGISCTKRPRVQLYQAPWGSVVLMVVCGGVVGGEDKFVFFQCFFVFRKSYARITQAAFFYRRHLGSEAQSENSSKRKRRSIDIQSALDSIFLATMCAR